MLYTCTIIVILFLCLIGYLVKFTVKDAADIITSPYNKRTSALAESTIRGKIQSANGKILATSEKNETNTRYYPYEDMFAHVVGYTGHGKAGLESAYNYELMTSHQELTTQFKNGLTNKKNTGDTLITTLDTRLQKAAYEALGSNRGAVIAIEPKTGKVRAMVSKPDFDPNELDEIWSEISSDNSTSSLLNRATQGLYPPGSTYKVITALEYLLENPSAVNDFHYICKGETIVNNVHINCYNQTEHGKEDMASALAHSCNTAFVTMGCELNLKKFLRLNQTCLFDSSIPFDLAVSKSRLGLNEKSDKSDLPQAVIGQGDTLMTPFHNALIMCAIANNGELMKPALLEEIQSADGTNIKSFKAEKYRTLLDASDASILKDMLKQAVTDGTGYEVDTDLYTAAGKTGTAENEGENAHAWFVGFSNVDDPDLVVCVIIENIGTGSHYAAPVAREVFDSYYNNEMYKTYR